MPVAGPSRSMRPTSTTLALALVIALTASCAAEPADGPADLGDFTSAGKADAVTLEVAFSLPAANGTTPGRVELSFRTLGALTLSLRQTDSRERLQIEAQSAIYRRRSHRGRAPFLTMPGVNIANALTPYAVSLVNWGTTEAHGTITVQTEVAPEPGIDVVFNDPDCPSCEDRSGGLRDAIVGAIQSARQSVDLAMYGFDDPVIAQALCEARKAGVAVRVVADDEVAELGAGDQGRYHDALLSPTTGLVACDIPVVVVHSAGIMHQKFYVIDRETDAPLLVTGSTNGTVADLDQNHNHMLFVHGARELMDQYQGEFDQMFRHCATERLDGRANRCNECTPACMENRSSEQTYSVGDSRVSVYFSPTDDALRVLRGAAVARRATAPDPACDGPDASCICRTSGATGWVCDYCAQGADGWGLVGAAHERLLVDVYSGTDACLALGIARAAQRGVRTLGIWDFVKAGSPYSRDDYLAGMGVTTYVTKWGGGSAQVRNHHKTVVVDDVVFDGSMNLSAAGATVNDENTLVITDALLARRFDEFIQSEARLLESLGVRPSDAATSRCHDLVDNDGDGLADASDPDCDAPSSDR